MAASGVIVAMVGGIVSVVIALINARNRTEPAPPPPSTNPADTADLVRRADDNDERDDVQDRRHNRTEAAIDRHADRLERLEAHHDRTSPGWRREP